MILKVQFYPKQQSESLRKIKSNKSFFLLWEQKVKFHDKNRTDTKC